MIFLFLFFFACNSIGFEPQNQEQYLSEVKQLIQNADFTNAEKKLQGFFPTNKDLKAKKYNLLGLIASKKNNTQEAYKNFLLAKEYSQEESIVFNYLISAFKLKKFQEVEGCLNDLSVDRYSIESKKKYYALFYNLAQEKQDTKLMFFYFLNYSAFDGKKEENFKKLNYLFKSFDQENQLLLQKDLEYKFPQAFAFFRNNIQTEIATEIQLEEPAKKYSVNKTVFICLQTNNRLTDKIINTVKMFKQKNADFEIELLENLNVSLPEGSILIGGMLSSKVKEEISLAKKYKAFYISLIPLNFIEKNSFIIEIPPSLESQTFYLKELLKEDILLLTINEPEAIPFFLSKLLVKDSYNIDLSQGKPSFQFLKNHEITKEKKILTPEELKNIPKEKSLSYVEKKDLYFKTFIYGAKPEGIIQVMSFLEYSDYDLHNFIGSTSFHGTKFGKKIQHIYDPFDGNIFKQDYKMIHEKEDPGLLAAYLYEALSLSLKMHEGFTTRISTDQGTWTLEGDHWIKELKISR